MTAYQTVLKIYRRTRTAMRPALGLRQYLMTQKVLCALEYLYDQDQVSRTILSDGSLAYHY